MSSEKPTRYVPLPAYARRDFGARSQTLSKVLGILGTTAIFTVGGAALGPYVGAVGFGASLFGSLVCLVLLRFLKEVAPLNVILLYAFATLEGVALGTVLERYVDQGMGLVVMDAAASTAAVTIVAGAYGYATRSELSGLGGILFMGLIGVILASLVGLVLQVSLFTLLLSAATAVLFVGYLAYDLNRIARTREVSPGDAILLAVDVYLDILNLFLALLRILLEAAGDD